MSASGSRPPRLTVLVVEDEPLQRIMAVDLVEEAGFEAVEAMGSGDAVRILEGRSDIWMVFTDIDMPGGLDGMALAGVIRDRWPPIELIIVSGRRVPHAGEMPVRGLFFAKPYKRDEVTAAMQELVA